MPELDYMVLADYVRQDGGGVIHIMGAGVDTVMARSVPAAQPFGIALRLSFDTTEPVGEQHQLTLAFQDPDQPVVDMRAQFITPPQPPGVPEHWRTSLGIALQITVPIPRYGDYSFELDIDNGAITRSIDVRVIPPPDPGPGT
jgi:hypothetical protein